MKEQKATKKKVENESQKNLQVGGGARKREGPSKSRPMVKRKEENH
jgi:hypothetical protein